MWWGVGKQRSVGEGVYLEEHFGSLCESLQAPGTGPRCGLDLDSFESTVTKRCASLNFL